MRSKTKKEAEIIDIERTYFDPIYDVISFSGKINKGLWGGFSPTGIIHFLNTFELSRLNFLRQSGFLFLTDYPSSTHN